MAIVPGSNTHEHRDYSRPGCRSRRVDCKGTARAQDARRRTALKEAKAEAKRQMEEAINEVHRDIHCPSDGCERGACVRVGNWYTGNTLGSSSTTKRVTLPNGKKGWEAKAKRHKEIRLKCRCR